MSVRSGYSTVSFHFIWVMTAAVRKSVPRGDATILVNNNAAKQLKDFVCISNCCILGYISRKQCRNWNFIQLFERNLYCVVGLSLLLYLVGSSCMESIVPIPRLCLWLEDYAGILLLYINLARLWQCELAVKHL